MLVQEFPAELVSPFVKAHTELQVSNRLLQESLEFRPTFRSVGSEVLKLAESRTNGRPYK